MRRSILAASVAAAALIPSIAYAQSSCERQRSNQVAGTVAGAVVGGVLGTVIVGRGDKTAGTIIGAGVGGVVGNQVSKPDRDCSRAYGYYDENNRWHATGVRSADARGYYDRDGGWVDGAPNGYYGSGNRWISNSGATGEDGYYSQDRGWVPASVNGYYDQNDQWVAGTASGYYDSDGHWHAGEARGYYDSRGRWVSTMSGDDHIAPNRDIIAQLDRLDSFVRSSDTQRRLGPQQAFGAQRELRSIRMREQGMRHDSSGELSIRDEAQLQLRLDRLSRRLQLDPS